MIIFCKDIFNETWSIWYRAAFETEVRFLKLVVKVSQFDFFIDAPLGIIQSFTSSSHKTYLLTNRNGR